jgi:hypothetical protein
VAVDDATRDKVAAHLKKVWRGAGCVLCGCTTWELHGYVTVVLGDAPGGGATGTEGLPCVALVCQRCGNTVFINLVVANAVVPLG